MLTVFDVDLPQLGFDPAIHSSATVGQAPINTANGIVLRGKIKMEMKIVSAARQELTPWFIEDAVVQPILSGSLRLSGNAMRQYPFFATTTETIREHTGKCLVTIYNKFTA